MQVTHLTPNPGKFRPFETPKSISACLSGRQAFSKHMDFSTLLWTFLDFLLPAFSFPPQSIWQITTSRFKTGSQKSLKVVKGSRRWLKVVTGFEACAAVCLLLSMMMMQSENQYRHLSSFITFHRLLSSC